jgi:hypothetical protein
VAELRSRPDVRLCRGCVDRLAGKLGVLSTPTLPVVELEEAKAFYERAGFNVRTYIDPEGQPGGYAFVDFDGQSVFDLGVEDIDPDRNRAGCYLVVHDVDGWHARMDDARLPVTAVADQPWGMPRVHVDRFVRQPRSHRPAARMTAVVTDERSARP